MTIALFPHCGFLSETSRMLHIGRALQAAGEPVVFATHGGPYTRVLDDAGVPWTALAPAMDGARCARFAEGLQQLGRPGRQLMDADEVRAGVAAEVGFLRSSGARAVVIGFTLTAYLSARLAGVPLVASHGGSFVAPVFERGLAPAPVQSPVPGTDWLPRWVLRKMANTAPPRMRQPVAFLNAVAAELGVEPVPSLAALMLGDLTLVTDLPEVLGISDADLQAWRPDASYRPATRLRYTGPLFAQLELPLPEPVQRFLQAGRPVAYVVLSSSTAAFYRQVVAGVRQAGVNVLVGATTHDLRDLEGHGVMVAGLLPNHRVMPQVDVALIMGGQGSVQTAMASGTPFVGFPMHAEQELNVGLGLRHGMALAIGPRHASPLRVARAVRRITADAAFKAAAQRVRALYDGVDGAQRAAQAVLDHLQQPDHAERGPAVQHAAGQALRTRAA